MEGRLSATPLPTLLLDLARQGFSGRLLLRRGPVEKRVELRHGWPALVESSRASESLANVLRETGQLSADAAASLARHAGERGGRELQSARELGLLPPRALLAAVAEHARRCLLDAFAWSEAEFLMEPAPADGPASGVDPLPLVQEGLETHWDLERLLAAFADHAGEALQRGPEAGAAEARIRRDEAVERLLESVEGLPLAQALRTAASPRALAAAWVLVAFGAWRLEAPGSARVETGASPEPPRLEFEVRVRGEAPEEAAPEAAPGPAVAVPDDVEDRRAAALRAEVEALHARLADLDHYEVLGVPRNASPADIRRAYMKAAKRFHPDAVTRLGLDDLKARANELFTRVARAHAVLSNAEERRAYDERAGDEEQGQANRLAQAEMLYRKASVLLRAGRFREAAELLEPCVSLWPDEPAYRIELAWALFKQPRPRLDEARKQLEQALAQDGRNALARQRLSLVLAELGDGEGAAQAGAAARRQDPNRA